MPEWPSLARPLDEIVEQSQIPYPNKHPYTHITFGMVVWNDVARAARLLLHVQPYFRDRVVIVQRSSDGTLDAVRPLATAVYEDDHRGYGDASWPRLLQSVTTPWTLRLDADELPTEELLDSLSNATWAAQRVGTDGVWIPFRSAVEGGEYEEQHSHLRLFRTHRGWPGRLHSRPPVEDGILWHTGHIRHDRSLQELLADYLRYWDIGRGNQGWEDHNRLMMRSACTGTAAIKGWKFVKALEEWPRVLEVAFEGKDPEGGTSGNHSSSRRRRQQSNRS